MYHIQEAKGSGTKKTSSVSGICSAAALTATTTEDTPNAESLHNTNTTNKIDTASNSRQNTDTSTKSETPTGVPPPISAPVHMLIFIISKLNYEVIKERFPEDVGALQNAYMHKLWKYLVEKSTARCKETIPPDNMDK